MIAIISPAKNMKRDTDQLHKQLSGFELTSPAALRKTEYLWSYLKKYSPWELESLLKVNEQLAVQAFMDFQDFSPEKKGQAALLSYDGLVFKNIEAHKFTEEELKFANSHLRILSAFYGVLQPMDHIMPYRLEMQCKLKLDGSNLYQFWHDELYRQLYREDEVIINLASEEYAKSVRKHLKEFDQFIDIEFVVMKQGKLKTIATWAKMARGRMIQYIIGNQIKDTEQIKEFDWNGYCYEPSLSYDNKYVFLQTETG